MGKRKQKNECEFCQHMIFSKKWIDSSPSILVESIYTATHALVGGEFVLYSIPIMDKPGYKIRYCPECGQKLLEE